MAAGLAGILVAPMSAPYLWVVLLGLGQNAAFPLALMLIVMRGGSVATTEGLSTLAQSAGEEVETTELTKAEASQKIEELKEKTGR